jgi:hypothetical protein
MKCEICEKEGTNYVSSRYGRDVYLCEDHRLTVLEYIESLKPKLVVEIEGAGYMVVRPNSHQSMWVAFDQADALYNYMRREREG